MLNIGIWACGNIAGILAALCAGRVEISACYDIDQPRMDAFAQRVGAHLCRDVELWADPTVTSNRHEIEAIGEFGRVTICTENQPSPENPAASYLAELSVLALLADLDDPIRVGT